MEDKKGQKKSEYTGLVPAVDQAARILIFLAKHHSSKVKLIDVCAEVGIHKSKGFSILNTLQKYGIVQKDPAGKTYSLGLGLISLSRKVLDSLDYGTLAHPILKMVAEKTNSTALFGILRDENVFVVARQEVKQQISVTIRLGYRFSVSHGAHGKAIAAFLPEIERKALLKGRKLFFHGTAEKLDRQRLDVELARCREMGYAFDMGELNAGINVIAAPVFDSQDRPVGSLFIMGTFSESRVEEYGAVVADSARQFSEAIGANVMRAYGK